MQRLPVLVRLVSTDPIREKWRLSIALALLLFTVASTAAHGEVNNATVAEPPAIAELGEPQAQPLPSLSGAEDVASNTRNVETSVAESSELTAVESEARPPIVSQDEPALQKSDIAQNNAPVLAREETSRERLTSTILLLAIMCCAVSFVVLFVLGLTNKVVIFYDSTDLAITIGSFFAPPITFLLGLIPFVGDLVVLTPLIWIVGGLVSIGLVVTSFRNAIRYNDSVALGLIVGVFKFMASLIGWVVLMQHLTQAADESSSHKQSMVSLAIVGMVGVFARRLINGEKVLTARGRVSS
jgi:hypothetical protein